ncbi:MAG: hypothetical protein Q7U60_00440 [Candidatus Methanoperedens sp.]|nr:hypothetical protein [Candidatus Methanoperedens sp.]
MPNDKKPALSLTNLQISKRSLALFNQLEAEEAGKRGMGGMKHDDFMMFLLYLYMQVKGDDMVLTFAREKAKKAGEQHGPL